jgi:hypothetical protein
VEKPVQAAVAVKAVAAQVANTAVAADQLAASLAHEDK